VTEETPKVKQQPVLLDFNEDPGETIKEKKMKKFEEFK
jgi:hypothetical protein